VPQKRAVSLWLRGRPRAVLGVGLVVLLVAIGALFYSGWHRHNLAARQACVFSPLEGNLSVEPGGRIELAPLQVVLGSVLVAPAIMPLFCVVRPRSARDPPA